MLQDFPDNSSLGGLVVVTDHAALAALVQQDAADESPIGNRFGNRTEVHVRPRPKVEDRSLGCSSSAWIGSLQIDASVPTPGNVVSPLSRYAGIGSDGRSNPNSADAIATRASARLRAAAGSEGKSSAS